MAALNLPRVYLDDMASTPIDEAVLDAMLPWLRAAGIRIPAMTSTEGLVKHWRRPEARSPL